MLATAGEGDAGAGRDGRRAAEAGGDARRSRRGARREGGRREHRHLRRYRAVVKVPSYPSTWPFLRPRAHVGPTQPHAGVSPQPVLAPISWLREETRWAVTATMASHALGSAVFARPLATRGSAARRGSPRAAIGAADVERDDDARGGGGVVRVDGASSMDARGGGVAGLLAGALALTLAPAAPALAAGKQPIDWLLEETVSGASSLGGIVKESLAESGVATKEAPAPSADDEDEGASGGGIDVGSTAVKFGKLGVILVFADVVTFAVMGRSVLGIMDDGGEEGWKAKVADQIMERVKEKEAAAAAEQKPEEGGDGER